jgi:hypothetical protein
MGKMSNATLSPPSRRSFSGCALALIFEAEIYLTDFSASQ